MLWAVELVFHLAKPRVRVEDWREASSLRRTSVNVARLLTLVAARAVSSSTLQQSSGMIE
jgi:hypothetical protein